MTMYCGRDFSPTDIQTIRDLIAQEPALLRSPLSRRLCEQFGWFKPNGELKDMTCRVALLRMHEQGLITLPASRIPVARRRPDFPATPASDPQCPLLLPAREIAPLTLRLVATAPVSRLWNETIQRYHYLGYTAMSGSQLRYSVYAGDKLVALLSFGASAWTLAARDSFIGWHTTQRLKNLHLVVNNARFLILPWIQCKGLASKRPVHRQPPTAHRLAAALSLQAGAARNLRRVRAPPRHLLQGRQLDPRRQDCRPRQEVPCPRADHSRQGHLALPTSAELQNRPLRLKPPPAKPAYGSTECLPRAGLRR